MRAAGLCRPPPKPKGSSSSSYSYPYLSDGYYYSSIPLLLCVLRSPRLFFSPTYFRHARLIPVDVRVTSQHTRDSVFQSWKSWKGGMKWEANNKKYKVLGKRREKKRKLSADFCVRDDITTEHSVGDIKGTSQPSTLFFFPSKFFFFFQLGHVEARESESFSPLFYPRIPFCASFGRATHSKATRQGDLPTDGCSEAVEWRRRRRQYRANEK